MVHIKVFFVCFVFSYRKRKKKRRKTIRTCRYEEIFCVSCKDSSKIEIGKHIMECKSRNNWYDMISYILDYKNQ